MSDYERNKGKLIPFDLTEDAAKLLVEAKGEKLDDFYESYKEQVSDDYTWYNENLAKVNDKWYTVEWEVKRGEDVPDFAEASLNEDGSIDFHTYHYNGGAHWIEIVEGALDGSN